ncbi:GFA family protein [Pararhodobacter zhoushanensis]|uniref:GFA family protein n=1 Tax=Pararhodobacter zhoushanensis TaxID=2479545 RepID=UPI000F8C51DA|nr:GFA family protein [Pararhodobacter zhoushanensis]
MSAKPYALPAEGGCRCGALRFRVTAQPIMSAVCHCTGCQRMSGGAFSTTLMVPVTGFEVTEGTPVRGGTKKPGLVHNHCPECLSWVFTRIEGVDAFLNLRATMLDEASGFVPFIETYTSEKLAWVETPAPHTYETFPPMDAFPALLGDYATLIASEER